MHKHNGDGERSEKKEREMENTHKENIQYTGINKELKN